MHLSCSIFHIYSPNIIIQLFSIIPFDSIRFHLVTARELDVRLMIIIIANWFENLNSFLLIPSCHCNCMHTDTGLMFHWPLNFELQANWCVGFSIELHIFSINFLLFGLTIIPVSCCNFVCWQHNLIHFDKL